jgi:hypothetical protein
MHKISVQWDMPPKLYFEINPRTRTCTKTLASLTLGFATTADEQGKSTGLAAEAAITSKISPLIIYSNGLDRVQSHARVTGGASDQQRSLIDKHHVRHP